MRTAVDPVDVVTVSVIILLFILPVVTSEPSHIYCTLQSSVSSQKLPWTCCGSLTLSFVPYADTNSLKSVVMRKSSVRPVPAPLKH